MLIFFCQNIAYSSANFRAAFIKSAKVSNIILCFDSL